MQFLSDRVLPGAVKAALWIWVATNIALVAWIGLNSVKTSGELFTSPLSLPEVFQWENFSRAWSAGGFGQALVSTAVVAVVASVITTVIAAPAGYVLARSTRSMAAPITGFFALGMSIPHQAIVVPYYLMGTGLGTFMEDWVTGWWDPRITLVLAYGILSLPFAVFVFTGYFRSLPVALEEAAAIDGATGAVAFRKVMLPLAKPGIKTVFILNLVGLWNETLLVLVLVPDASKRTLGASLLNFETSIQYTSDWAGLFAGVVIVVFPMLFLYLWLGRRIIEGMTAGAGK